MNKYEYKILRDSAVVSYSVEDINELGKKGWRVIQTIVSDGSYQTTILERELTEKKKCKCPKGYHKMFKNCRGY